MSNILKTHLLEYDKSAFLIDLLANNNKQKYIRIEQTILDTKEKNYILINPVVLSDLISVLQSYQLDFDKKKAHCNPNINIVPEVTNKDQEKIVARYLKGVPSKDLSLQFGVSPSKIEQILFNKNIEIIDAKEELKKVGKRFRKRRRRK